MLINDALEAGWNKTVLEDGIRSAEVSCLWTNGVGRLETRGRGVTVAGAKCGESCQEARSLDCRCSCGGLNHGIVG